MHICLLNIWDSMTSEMGFIYQDVSSYYEKFQLKIFKSPEVLPEWEKFVLFEK